MNAAVAKTGSLLVDLKDALRLLARLDNNPTLVAEIAGAVVAVVAKVLGVDLTVAEVAGWLAAVGLVAETVQNLLIVRKAKAAAKAARARRAKR